MPTRAHWRLLSRRLFVAAWAAGKVQQLDSIGQVCCEDRGCISRAEQVQAQNLPRLHPVLAAYNVRNDVEWCTDVECIEHVVGMAGRSTPSNATNVVRMSGHSSLRYRCARVQERSAVAWQQVSNVPLQRAERRQIWKDLHDRSSSVADAALREEDDGSPASLPHLRSARQPALDGHSGPDSAVNDGRALRDGQHSELDAVRVAVGFAHVLRGVYAVGSDWSAPTRLELLRDIAVVIGNEDWGVAAVSRTSQAA